VGFEYLFDVLLFELAMQIAVNPFEIAVNGLLPHDRGDFIDRGDARFPKRPGGITAENFDEMV